MLFLSNITGGNKLGQLINWRMNNVGSLSGSMSASNKGLLELLTSDNEPYFYNGASWLKFRSVGNVNDIPLPNGQFLVGNGSGQAAATAKSSIPLSGFAAAASSVSLGSQSITNLGSPVGASDAATKGYVDSVAQGLQSKKSCTIATSLALPRTPTYLGLAGTLEASSNGALTNTEIDSGAGAVTLVVGMRILVKDQATQFQNGIYTINVIGGAGTPYLLQRAEDADNDADLSSAFTFVERGTSADSGWVQSSDTHDVDIVSPTGTIVWTQFSAAGTITAGNGMVKVGDALHFAQSANYTAGQTFYASSTTAVAVLAIGTVNRFMYSTGSLPSWSAYAMPAAGSTLTANTLLFASSTTQVSTLATGNSGVLITSGAGVPSIATSIPTAVTIGGSYIYRVGGTDITLADGGSNASLTAVNGGIVWSSASAMAISAAGTASRHLLSGGAGAPTWANYALPSTVAANALLYATSATAVATLATQVSSVLTTNGSSVPTWVTFAAGQNPARGTIGSARKWSQQVVGDAVNAYITVTHNLNTSDLVYSIRLSASVDTLPLEYGITKVECFNVNSIRIYFSEVQSAATYYVVTIIG